MTSIISQSRLYDPSSLEYKKARRQHVKTTRNRAHDVDENWTPFRTAEKKYKARFPPPDLSAVVDLSSLASGAGEAHQVRCISTKEAAQSELSGTADIFTLPAVPGLVLLPSFVSPEDQRRLVRWSLRNHARHPNETNLDAHYVLPPEGIWNAHLQSRAECTRGAIVRTKVSVDNEPLPRISSPGPRQLISNDAASADNFHSMQTLPKIPPDPSTTVSDCLPSELIPKLRWANIGWSYHWGSKQYDFSKGKGDVDPRVRDLCKSAVGSVPWEEVYGHDHLEGWGGDDWRMWQDTYEPDAGIVNFYQTKDTLMAHVDRSEVCATSPLVSISLGNAAIFLIGGLTRDTEPTPILLRSGDVVIMSGPACRRAYHGVPRILENTLPEHFSQAPDHDGDDEGGMEDWELYRDYMQTTRININVRQVFPKGFDPGT
ncbi:hypothetical protein PAXRUDRAFT_827205 [Paxillus rubicundulus Ve08.2h10]|uniref:Fe2OG dioxygenase domain-containing protein n=1 Tax=Paxillus rubicundulus Ve08.2h10 TaxID=930991 RepID=A0A0D0DYE8_9AGAM|nr:hypothetical protein PAXRUDRAFT_827205 [Paxillus rubicundulus Ve08.2h10]